MARSDIKAGAAFVELYVKNSALFKGLNAAKAQLQSFGKNVMAVGGFFTGLGAAILVPLAGAVKHFTAVGSALADMHGRTGKSVADLAELGFAARQTGTDLGDVEKAIRFKQKSGSKESFDQAAERIAGIADADERTKEALKAFGKTGANLIPMLGNLKALRQEARDLNLVPSEQAVNSADEIGDAIDKVMEVASAAVFEVGAAVAPMLLPALQTITKIGAAVTGWVKQNGALVRTVAMIGGGLVAAGAAITAAGAGVFAFGSLLGAAGTIVTAIGTAAGALASPVGIALGLVAAVGLGIFAWVRYTESGKAALAGLIGFVTPLFDRVRATVAGIGDALMAGDLALAGKIAVTGLQATLAQGLAQIASLFGGTFGDVIGDIGTRLLSGDLQGAWSTVVAGMAAVWASFTSGLVEVFTGAATAVTETWRKTVTGLSGALLDQSSQGGVFGKVASLALGVDLAAEQRKSDELTRQQNELNRKHGIGEIRATDVTGEAKAAAAGQIKAQADAAKNFLASVNAAAKNKASEAGEAFRERVAGGSTRAADAAQQLADDLAGLRARAAEAKAAAQAGGAGAPGDVPSELGKLASGAFVTFSGAGLLAAGQGGGPQQAVVRELVKNRQLQKQELENDERMIRELEKGRPRFK